VSTSEVEAVIQKVSKFSDCVVFGVSIDCCEGKAGMAVIAAKPEDLDLKVLAQQLIQHLPQYSIPLFLRLTQSIELTGSYKQSKTKVEKEGFNPNVITDNLYFLDKPSRNYIPLDNNLYQEIQSGNVSL
jgi:acyl-CoA synthetase (AMP-forming)/AMP-acid ligase II